MDTYRQIRDARRQSLRAQVREFELAYASIFFKNFLLREIHKANFRRDVIYIHFQVLKMERLLRILETLRFFSWI